MTLYQIPVADWVNMHVARRFMIMTIWRFWDHDNFLVMTTVRSKFWRSSCFNICSLLRNHVKLRHKLFQSLTPAHIFAHDLRKIKNFRNFHREIFLILFGVSSSRDYSLIETKNSDLELDFVSWKANKFQPCRPKKQIHPHPVPMT